MQEVTAKLRFLRMGPRKVRLIVDMIRGKKVTRALDLLSVMPKRAARPVLKLLNSAVANAKHNYSLNVEDLKVAQVYVDGGPVLKRWMPKAHGRATPIRERTSHINLVLGVMEPKAEKSEALNPKSETNPKLKIKKTKK
ncbi:MAG: 50S ribosomal protein L22 [Candidatus Magasanikbacteria bacterium GW2011_GWA2_40_10]|uniref:Large ribosomal subunit protein uL22 n=1 Tax=Candidatus Magasanikbacteria bacterium GW2011_GWA2_40_10 TaxID=1619037 RepID=A0A0G0Q453_9BACT|nr:MAG: 50S ribosomal protein L22 [Candidatus Magasanikbacteria bacterium GW2011_GWA2_40_10]